MEIDKKLTKKQRKGLAFRERKAQKKGGGEGNDLPEVDTLPVDAEDAAVEAPRQKRKREEIDENTERPTKKLKALPKEKAKPRFILFLGNLNYRTSKEAILEHFKSCVPPPAVRLLTPKNIQSVKSKGCAFLEFSTASSLQTGLKLHGTELEGRKVNVELTSGGGGKSQQRVEKVRQKNKKLQNARSQPKLNPNGSEITRVQGVERHSTTSGVEVKLMAAEDKTWSIPKAGEKKSRGGRKHSKHAQSEANHVSGHSRNPRRQEACVSGANAINVG